MTLSRREFIKMSGAAVLWLSGPGYASARAVSIPVLVYHDIVQPSKDKEKQKPERETLTPPLFAAELEWLYEAGYRAISLNDLEKTPVEQMRRAVIITFDDGYASFMDYVFPLLVQYGMKATINVIGKHMGSYVRGNDPRLSWDECRFLRSSGLVDIGCHTFDLHTMQAGRAWTSSLAALNEKLRDDLGRFQSLYTREMGQPATILAWPYGMHDSRSIEIATQAGFHFLLNSNNRSFIQGAGHTDIPRFTMQGKDALTRFREVIEERV